MEKKCLGGWIGFRHVDSISNVFSLEGDPFFTKGKLQAIFCIAMHVICGYHNKVD